MHAEFDADRDETSRDHQRITTSMFRSPCMYIYLRILTCPDGHPKNLQVLSRILEMAVIIETLSGTWHGTTIQKVITTFACEICIVYINYHHVQTSSSCCHKEE